MIFLYELGVTMPPTYQRYSRTARVAPEPPQLSLREEIATYKAKLRAIKAARIAAQPPPSPPPPVKLNTRAKRRQERTNNCCKAIKLYFKALHEDFTSGFRRRAYMCMGFMCCMTSEVRAFVDDEFPRQVPVV
jgi:hypothetical protein